MIFQFKKSKLATALLMSLPLIALAEDAVINSPVTQSANNSGNVTNAKTGSPNEANGMNITGAASPAPSPDLGAGASASISASGAVASVSVTNNFSAANPNTNDVTIPSFGIVTQDATNQGDITNLGTLGFSEVVTLGNGASASISASGAVSSISHISYGIVNTNPATPEIGATTQLSANLGTVENGGAMTGSNTVTLSGDGASVSISASGAVASISSTFNGATLAGESTYSYGNIDQTATNGAEGPGGGAGISPAVTNTNTNQVAGLALGNLSGNGASASISASGAVASIAFTLNNTVTSATPAPAAAIVPIVVSYGTITQEAKNYGDITNIAATLSIGSIVGEGASASSSASGSVASFSVASITSDYINLGNFGAISQTSTNHGAVANSGNMQITGSFGVGANASISASGAVSSISFRAVQ